MTDVEPPTETSPTESSARVHALPLLPIAAGAAVFGVCCGLPVLASLGVTGAVVGLGAGSWVVVAVASIAAVIGMLRWRRQRRCHSIAGSTTSSVATPVAGGEAPLQQEDVK